MISMPRGAGPQLSAEHPFPGLRPFRFNDREFFFGREDQIYALYRLLELSRFVAVIGSSGSGKSSLVRAGLLPLLQEESESAGERAWRSVVLSPGDAPLSSLADALMSLAPAGESAESLTDHEIRRDRIRLALRRSSFGLAEALDEIPGARDTSLLIVVDQFEELFRFASPAGTGAAERIAEALWRDEAVSFVQQLLQITSGRERSVHVLVTMRSDFIGDCARFHGLPEAVSAAQFLTPSLSRDQWEDVIRRPIEKAGASIESALVERLLIDIATEPDPLPVLQHCLARLWEKAGEGERAPHQRRFELGAYIEIGGVANALSKHADEVMSRDLPGPELELAVQQVFRALSEVDKEGRAKRRALPYAQLRDEAGVPEADLRNVLDRFRAEDVLFIVPPLSEMRMLQDQTRVDVVHEALLRRWDKISPETGHKLADDALDSGWLAAEDADGRLYRALLALLDGGSESGPVTLPGEQVGSRWRWWTSRPRTEAWAKRYGGRLAEVNKLFADSRAEVEAARQRDEAALAARSEARRNRAIVLWALPALLIAVGFAIFAFFQMNSARANEQLARKNERLAIEANANMRAALKAKDAAQKNAVVEARRAVYQAEAASAARSKAEAQEKIAQIAMTRARRESAAANAATERAMRAADRANKDEARVKALSSAAVRAARLQAKAELRLRAAQVAAQRTRALVASLQVAAYATGVVYEARDQYTDAITEFDQAIRLKPQDYTAWSARGWSYRALRKNDLAITDLKTALRLNPKDRLSLSRLAQIYVDQRNYDEAIRYLDRRLGLPPIDSWAYTLRGDAYSAKLQFDRAIDDYNEALKLKPNYYAALVGRADTFELQGDHARALEDYNAAIEASPAWSVAYRARGVSELNQNRFQEALDDLHHANVLQPSDPYAVLWMQLVRWKTGAGNGSLATDAKYLDRKVWPWPVVALVQGSMTPDQVLATAKKNDLPSRGHECEALFYVGEYFLAARDPHGKGYIQAAADMCPSTYIEFVGARAELTRLGG